MIASGIYYLSTFALTMIVTASNSAGSLDNDNRTVASCFAYRSNRKIHVHSGSGVSDS